ncbi:E3 ubiquitin-protein ligase TRIM13 [Bombina bombina]|uniref:E3 ubiquitin-protein ligase TRIM13 n=1 Tax=Bombina bombina TaxID=8345 RepID=UPI00235A8448|nr:E3 ubiquitin-protein ligase TRIM13 [Bombina bombina]XP_053564350.1 E3 ubiquitin-protein ligase TRIM13 [Bombina bombina]XP_053564351.1 E3 ubiquitin-protein ligase TRIM13 [Bombina bombina]
MEVLEEDLTCPICCCLFDDPRVLPCSHNFCKKCLEGILEGSSRNMPWRSTSFKCPTCRKETSTMGVNGHQVNYLLKGIVEKYNTIKIAPKMPLCKIHSEQPLNMFCSTDLKLICGMCATNGEHTRHTFSSIEDAYEKERSSFKTLLHSFEDWHGGDVLSHLDTLEANKRKNLHLLTSDSEQVKAYFEKLQHVLEQKKNEILSDFETMKLGVMQAYDPEINKLNTVLNEQKKASSIAEDFKDISDPVIFLQQMQKFREKIQLIKKAALPSRSGIIVTPTTKNFDTSMWDNIKLVEVDKLSLPQETPSKKYNRRKCLLVFLALTFFLVGIMALWVMPVHFDHFPYFDIQYLKSSSVLFTTDITGRVVFYWELVAEGLSVLSKKCQSYTMRFLEIMAELVCKYKL